MRDVVPASNEPLDRFWRSGRTDSAAVRTDLLWLFGIAMVLIGAGLGFRGPWPADEPRFAVVAMEMIRSGNWLFPQIGGDWYADKPPVYFWMLAACLELTGSLQLALLLPSLIASLGTVYLIYDLARRLWGRDAAFTAALILLATYQFAWQGRQAQIDATLCFWTTLSIYALLRHLLLRPSSLWHAIGWMAAGFGVITKGVGFLPLLLLPIYGALRYWGFASRQATESGYRLQWWWGPLAFLGAVSVWLVPMLIASSNDPALLAYRNEILFHQTVDRYASAWMHRKPFWYFVVEVIPWLWLPFTLFVPWLWPRWRDAFKRKNLRVALPLLWSVAVVIFFSASPGKRGLYILPALPAAVLSAAPWLSELRDRVTIRKLLFGLAVLLAVVPALAAIYLLAVPREFAAVRTTYGIEPIIPLLTVSIGGAIVCALMRQRAALLSYLGVFGVALLVVGFWVGPAIDASRSSSAFVAHAEEAARDVSELGILAYREQFLLYFKRPTTNFGHARWTEYGVEDDDAAVWLAADGKRGLLMRDENRARCFASAKAEYVGETSDEPWYLVTGQPNPECLKRGHAQAARRFEPFPLLEGAT